VRGAVAIETIATGEHIMTIPRALMMTPVAALDSPELGPVFRDDAKLFVGDMLLVVFIMHERSRGDGSFWAPFLNTLPAPTNICDWDDDELAELQHARLVQRVRSRCRQVGEGASGRTGRHEGAHRQP